MIEPSMLNFDAEQWALLNTVPQFAEFLAQLRTEQAAVCQMLGNMGVLDADNAQRTAVNYALNCGRLAAIREILEYQPREETDDNG